MRSSSRGEGRAIERERRGEERDRDENKRFLDRKGDKRRGEEGEGLGLLLPLFHGNIRRAIFASLWGGLRLEAIQADVEELLSPVHRSTRAGDLEILQARRKGGREGLGEVGRGQGRRLSHLPHHAVFLRGALRDCDVSTRLATELSDVGALLPYDPPHLSSWEEE